jgi:hypothetical protein
MNFHLSRQFNGFDLFLVIFYHLTQFQAFFQTKILKIEFLVKFNKSNEALELIEKGVAKYPDNIYMWVFNLKLKIDMTNQDNEEKLFECFYKSIKSVQPKVIARL